MIDDLKIIKKRYGEDLSKLCRQLFPTLLETPGLLSRTLLEHFDDNHFLYNDIISDDLISEFRNYIFTLVAKDNEKNTIVNETPEELMLKQGYILKECHTESNIQSYRKYYREDELLCTFKGGRLKDCRVFFAIKINADEIKRENFSTPDRQDEYGTSVLSIQFAKDGSNMLSIKNRYNHTVANPDATFSNDLDNIVSGLTDSFEKYYGIVQKYKSSGFESSNYVMANDGKYYKYNYEINNVYYCPNNIIIDNFVVHKYDHSKYIVVDYFIFDLVNKKIYLYDLSLDDSFVDMTKNTNNIKINKVNNKKIINVTSSDETNIILTINDKNEITKLVNNNATFIKDDFLRYNEKLMNLDLNNVKKIGNYFLCNNCSLTSLNLPNLESVGISFCYFNDTICGLSLPRLKEINSYFLLNNRSLGYVDLPSLEKVGNNFIYLNKKICFLNAPNLKIVGNSFLQSCQNLKILYLPLLEKVGNDFLSSDSVLEKIYLPNLKSLSPSFLNSYKKREEFIKKYFNNKSTSKHNVKIKTL